MTALKDINLYAIGNSIQIVGAVYAGDGKMLVCLFPEDQGTIASDRPIPVSFVPKDGSEELAVESLNMSQEEWGVFLRQTDLLEVEIIEKASDGTMAKAILRKSARQIDQATSWNVYRRDGYRCRYCGNDKIPLTVDHLVLWEDRGPNTEENLVSACRKCNKTRGDTKYADWLKHPHYLRVSRGLTPEVRAANEALLGTLDKIPLAARVKTR